MPKKTTVYRVFIVLLLVVLVGGVFIFKNRDSNSETCDTNQDLTTTEISINGKKYSTEIAETARQKQLGLSGRDCITEDHAMLFPYELSGDYCFWMKDMNFPIDMVWLDDEKTIVTIEPEVSPDTYPKSFCPEKPANYIVEFKSGSADAGLWTVDDKFVF